MQVTQFVEVLRSRDINFYTGVPDSQLRALCDYLAGHFGNDPHRHVIAHNEGGSVGLASGYHLATGKVPCVYLQNSGLGNIVNPCASLTSTDVYAIPVLYIVGWRGQPGVADEPQHVYQGKISIPLLDDLAIPCAVLGKGTTADEIEAAMNGYENLFRQGKSAAFLVERGGLTHNEKHHYQNGYSLVRERAIEIISDAAKEDLVVSSTGKISRELFEIREMREEGHEKDFLTVGSMGHASMIGLGVALNSGRRVWVIDGDGAMLMHMGALGTIGACAPDKLIHIVLNNEAHETVGGMPSSAGSIDFPTLAMASGYQRSWRAETETDLVNYVQMATEVAGPVLLEVRVALGARENLGRPNTTPVQNKQAFISYIQTDGGK